MLRKGPLPLFEKPWLEEAQNLGADTPASLPPARLSVSPLHREVPPYQALILQLSGFYCQMPGLSLPVRPAIHPLSPGQPCPPWEASGAFSRLLLPSSHEGRPVSHQGCSPLLHLQGHHSCHRHRLPWNVCCLAVPCAFVSTPCGPGACPVLLLCLPVQALTWLSTAGPLKSAYWWITVINPKGSTSPPDPVLAKVANLPHQPSYSR